MKISKSFELSMGHRLSNYTGKCRHWHGHNYIGKLILEGNKLNELGMLMDYGVMKELIKDTIDARFDHKFVLKKDDVFNQAMLKLADAFEDKDSSFVVVNYNPTVENIILDMKTMIEGSLTRGIKVTIELSETSTSFAEA
jgi:6-pyruvoyltetrahydropterin/6-carboxytetrahydropterin synthase